MTGQKQKDFKVGVLTGFCAEWLVDDRTSG